jgi:hypothetical protein
VLYYLLFPQIGYLFLEIGTLRRDIYIYLVNIIQRIKRSNKLVVGFPCIVTHHAHTPPPLPWPSSSALPSLQSPQQLRLDSSPIIGFIMNTWLVLSIFHHAWERKGKWEYRKKEESVMSQKNSHVQCYILKRLVNWK